MFKQIKTFWSKKLKSGEQIYLVLMIIIIILSIYIAFIEINQINNINKELEVDRSNLEELKEIKDYSEHLDTLFSVYYSTGRSLDSQREEIKLDAMGATSIDLNFRMKDVIWQSCININSLYPFLNDTANCSQIISSEIVFDKSELQKLGSLKIDLINLIGDLKKRDRKSTRLNSSHIPLSRMPSSA